MIRNLFLAVTLSAVLAMGYASFAALDAAWTHRYSIAEMDWNEDGLVSPIEFWGSANVGVRRVIYGAVQCREFFSLKTGLPIREDCEESRETLRQVATGRKP